MANTQKEQLMKVLGITAQEADEIIAADKAIDRGERMDFDLPIEQEKRLKKLANAGTRKKPIRLETAPRPRKENPTKAGIVSAIATFLNENGLISTKNVEITNKERQIAFQVGDESFELTLVQKRKPKN